MLLPAFEWRAAILTIIKVYQQVPYTADGPLSGVLKGVRVQIFSLQSRWIDK